MITIRVEGVGEIQSELGQVVDRGKISHLLEHGAIAIEGEAKLRCPVATGRLQKSILHRKISDLTFEIAATADYADYIEFGTRYIESGTPEAPYVYMGPVTGKFPSYRPFLRSAAYGKISQITSMIEQGLNEKD